MSELLGCELCEREGIEAVGTTHLGGRRFEVCADCREIVKAARAQIVNLGQAAEARKRPDPLLQETVGVAPADVMPPCHFCGKTKSVVASPAGIKAQFVCVYCRKSFKALWSHTYSCWKSTES